MATMSATSSVSKRLRTPCQDLLLQAGSPLQGPGAMRWHDRSGRGPGPPGRSACRWVCNPEPHLACRPVGAGPGIEVRRRGCNTVLENLKAHKTKLDTVEVKTFKGESVISKELTTDVIKAKQLTVTDVNSENL